MTARGFSLVELLTSVAIAAVGITVAFEVTAQIQRATTIAATDSLLVFTAQHSERVIRASGRSGSTNFDPPQLSSILPAGISVDQISSTSISSSTESQITRVSFVLSGGTPVRTMPVAIYLHTSL